MDVDEVQATAAEPAGVAEAQVPVVVALTFPAAGRPCADREGLVAEVLEDPPRGGDVLGPHEQVDVAHRADGQVAVVAQAERQALQDEALDALALEAADELGGLVEVVLVADPGPPVEALQPVDVLGPDVVTEVAPDRGEEAVELGVPEVGEIDLADELRPRLAGLLGLGHRRLDGQALDPIGPAPVAPAHWSRARARLARRDRRSAPW